MRVWGVGSETPLLNIKHGNGAQFGTVLSPARGRLRFQYCEGPVPGEVTSRPLEPQEREGRR